MKEYISTKQVIQMLHVSRSWINTNIRHLGTDKGKTEGYNKISIMYQEKDIVDWFNANATFTRQTVVEDLTKYISIKNLEMLQKELDDITDKYSKNKDSLSDLAKRDEIANCKDKYYSKFLPSNIYNSYVLALLSVRHRGDVPHNVIDYKINKIEQLKTMNTIKGYNSEEMGYRHIYTMGLIKVTLNGRKWYIQEDENYKYKILLTVER